MTYPNAQPSSVNLLPQPDYAALPIVPATWRDLGAVMRLEKQCFTRDDAWSFLDHLAVLTLPGVTRLKIEYQDELIAFIASEKQPEKHTAWITTIGIAPHHQRHGLGLRLLSTCEYALKYPVNRLSVRRSNHGAIMLYRHAGYTLVDEWPKYYIGGEDALIFEKKFD
jgi:ribosomal protein S18 acetylase RimI-like enzyme